MEKEFIEEITETVEETEGKKRKKRNDEERDSHTLKGDPADIKELRDVLAEYEKPSKELVPIVTAILKIDRAKQSTPGLEKMVSTLQDCQTTILDLFRAAFQMGENAEARAEEIYKSHIEKLQQKNSDMEAQIESYKAKIEALTAEATEAKEKATEAQKSSQTEKKARETAETSVSLQKALIESLTAEKERLTAEAATVPELKKIAEDLRAEISAIQKEKETAERDLQAAKETAERTKKEAERDIQNAKKVFENERKAAVLETKEIYISKIEKKDEEISALKEKIAVFQRESVIAQLSAKEEISRLTREIEELKNASEQKKLEGI